MKAARRPRGPPVLGTPGCRGNRPPDPGTNAAPLRDGGGRRGRRVRGRRDHRTAPMPRAGGGGPRGYGRSQVAEQPDREGGQAAVGRVTRPLGGDPNTGPIVNARLADGSRVAICAPAAPPSTAVANPPLAWQDVHRQGVDPSGSLPTPGGSRGGGVNGHPKLNEAEQIVDRNILGSGIGHRQTRASPDERARSRRQGREPREAGVERSEAP